MTDLLFVRRTLEGKKKGVKNGVKAPGKLINNIHIIYTNLEPPMFAGTVLGCVWRRIKTSRWTTKPATREVSQPVTYRACLGVAPLIPE